MTDRVKGCYVAFDRDIRVDDVESILEAIKMIRGVSKVELNVSNADDWMNRIRIKAELGEKFLEFYKENL